MYKCVREHMSCDSEVQFLPEQVLHSYFLCLLSSNLTGDMFKRLGCWCSILEITINIIQTKAQKELSVQCNLTHIVYFLYGDVCFCGQTKIFGLHVYDD